MTKKEAIEILERGEWWEYLAQSPDNDAAIDPLQDALEEAIDALRAQEKVERNDPLTPEELREMDGEPVWVQSPGIPEYGRWAIVEGADVKQKSLHLKADYACHDYGTVWLAYRRKPEEGTV